MGASATAPALAGAVQRKRRRRRKRPPWGNLLGGKPIENGAYLGDKKIDLGETARRTQFDRMILLMRHYGIRGPLLNYPFAGVGNLIEQCWYHLALATASELDDSLTIIDAKPRSLTAARWRGTEGLVLLKQIDILQKRKPNRSIQWCLDKLQKQHPTYYGKINRSRFKTCYQEARKHHRGTKRPPSN